ncbi:MAG: (Fe-S)-binding protein [Bacteroidota bacterium]
MLQIIIFAIVSIAAFGYAGFQFAKIRRNILLGKDEVLELDRGQSIRNVFLVAFGQKKMFKRIIPAVLHLFIYVAFLFTQIELIEILIDGFFGVHRFFADKIGLLYTITISFIEILSVLAFVGTVVFILRRNVIKIPRLASLKGWAKLDGNLILVFEILLLIGIFSMNGADTVLQKLDPAHYPDTGRLAVSSWLGPALFGGLEQGTLQIIERFGWWLHIIMVFVFLNYLPKSKHLHILLAFPNTFYAKQEEKAEIENMPEVMKEVKSMMGLDGSDPFADNGGDPMEEELPDFGADDVFTLSWRNILSAYTCTECGRCTSVCPANQTGKKLSPRKILMDVRDRAEEVGKNLDSGNPEFIRADLRGQGVKLSKENYDDGKSLFDYVSREELHACTTCMACVEACPVLINPLDPILKMRRYEILTESAGPSDWLPMFNSIENSGSAWQIPKDRDSWAKEAVETVG